MTGEDLMPFGIKHKGKKMKDVPIAYLKWLFEKNICQGNVKHYIYDNIILKESIKTKN